MVFSRAVNDSVKKEGILDPPSDIRDKQEKDTLANPRWVFISRTSVTPHVDQSNGLTEVLDTGENIHDIAYVVCFFFQEQAEQVKPFPK